MARIDDNLRGGVAVNRLAASKNQLIDAGAAPN
jgi:hypothetical protein